MGHCEELSDVAISRDCFTSFAMTIYKVWAIFILDISACFEFRASDFVFYCSSNLGPPCNAEDSSGTEGQNQQQNPKGNEISEGRREYGRYEDLCKS